MSEPVSLSVNPDTFKPLIDAAVAEALERFRQELEQRGLINGRLAVSEPEAAALLGLEPHQLRDERRRGRITASAIVGKRIRYTREDLVGYLSGRRIGPEPAK